jgi:hypothetical protein
MIVDGCRVEVLGEGDLGGLAGRDGDGASTAGGSWAAGVVVLCEGVWLREETCVTVGDTAARRVSASSPASSSYRAH